MYQYIHSFKIHHFEGYIVIRFFTQPQTHTKKYKDISKNRNKKKKSYLLLIKLYITMNPRFIISLSIMFIIDILLEIIFPHFVTSKKNIHHPYHATLGKYNIYILLKEEWII